MKGEASFGPYGMMGISLAIAHMHHAHSRAMATVTT